jgi:hypothetical protein
MERGKPADGVVLRYGPSRRIAGLLAVGAAAAAVASYFATDATGRLLLGCAAIVLAAIAGVDVLFSPRLTATTAGVAVFAPGVRVRWRWDEVSSIKVDERNRRGLTTRTLEIESGDQLIVLSKRSLNADPQTVYADVSELRTRA